MQYGAHQAIKERETDIADGGMLLKRRNRGLSPRFFITLSIIGRQKKEPTIKPTPWDDMGCC